MSETPLIWTSHGNLPIDSLRYVHRWEETPDETALLEFWYLGDELVKNSVHRLGRKQFTVGAEQAQMA